MEATKKAPISLSQTNTQGAQHRALWRDSVTRLLHNRSAMVGLIIIIVLVLAAIFANVIATHDPLLSMIGIDGEVPPIPRKAPCLPLFGCTEPQHIMGLDLNGRDLFSRIIFGARTSLFIGMAVVLFATLTGTLIGLVSGYVGGWLDNLIMRIMDVLLAFPGLLLAITIVTIRGPGLQNALLAISIVSIPVYARLARASVLSVKELEFVTAARALGAGPFRIIFLQILPNILTPLVVQATLGIGTAVIEAAALSFLGLGAQPPEPEWGQILAESRNYVFTSPHMVFFPGIAITVTVLGFNLFGDGLRDVLDPRLRGSS
ncbi:MAG: ABC transporter permease [Anaerolineae bacterium]|nr:ABC transporter permease [Anaerolineae bacterium]